MNEIQEYILTRTINLDHEQLFLLEGRPGARIRALHRGEWLTSDDAMRDHFPHSVDAVMIAAHRRSIIESTGRSTIELHEPPHGVLKRLFAALRPWATSLLGFRSTSPSGST
jgi:hypothetical protein